MSRSFGVIVLFVIALVCACGDSVDNPEALDEPIRVKYEVNSTTQRAQFFTGDMPAPNGGPAIKLLQIGSPIMAPGAQNRGGYGLTLDDSAFTVGVRLLGRTTGYWVARVSTFDVLNGGVGATLLLDVSVSITPGSYQLELTGIDRDGHFGERQTAPVSIVPRLNTNGPAVISLKWDAGVDLDLQLATPYGTFLSPKRQVTAPEGTADAGTAAGYGVLDGDSVNSCVDDGLRQEDIVFSSPPIPGVYTIYVNGFSLCRLPGTNYQVTVLQNGNVMQTYRGNITAPQVQQGGFQLGDKVADVTF